MKKVTKMYGVRELFPSETRNSKPKVIGPAHETYEQAAAWASNRYAKGWKTDMKVVTIHRITNV